MEIAGKVAIVTGASSGIGLATARLFAQKGAKVALAARSADALQQLAKELPDSVVVPTDMGDDKAVLALIERVQQHYGRIDILINNAGRGMHVPIEKADLQQYRDILNLNVVSVIAAMQAVIPIMRAQGGGAIINISSGTSKMVLPSVGPYASTKYALNAISLTARKELEPDHILVSVVHPGMTKTNFSQNAIRDDQFSGERPQMMEAETAEQVAEKVLEAVQTGEAEIYSDALKARLNS